MVGAAGHLRLSARRIGDRTRLTAVDCQAPLQAMRAHYLDPVLTGMAFVTVMSPSGGVLQGDRLALEVDAGEGAQLHLGTASATRLYRMPGGGARQTTRVSVGPGALVELVPDPYLPYAGSRFTHDGVYEVAPTGTLILAEVVGAGRQARGEQLAYERFSNLVEVRRPGGHVLFRDSCVLEPASGLSRRGMLGSFAAMGSIYLVSPGLRSDVLATVLTESERDDVQVGGSELPGDAGAWLRVLALDSTAAMAVVGTAWRAARVLLTGAPPPAPRRY